MKIFSVIPTRNDAWILERVLASTSLWADQIIVVDENSWDDTPAICQKFPKVKIISFQPKQFNESYRRQKLLEAVRQWDGQNLVFGLDSDEILTSEVLKPEVMESLVDQLSPGMSASLQWIMLWKSCREYRYDNATEWSNNFKPFVYRDDRKMNFDNLRMHTPRVPEAATFRSIIFNKIRVLHYSFAEWEQMLSKHVYYLALEKTMQSTRHPFLLDRRYHWFLKRPSSGMIIKTLPLEWVEEYKKRGVDVQSPLEREEFYWYEAEVLRFFRQFGEKTYKHYNIWAVDWERKRRLAQGAVQPGLPEHPVVNPQPWYDRLYYKFIAPRIYSI